MFDLGIINGKSYINGSFTPINIFIKNGKISKISNSKEPSSQIYDAANKLVMPGFIDPHVHFSLTVGQNTSSDDFQSGSKAAAAGGITTFIDFLDPIKSVDEFDIAFSKRLELAKNSCVDYSFHACVANLKDNPDTLLEKVNLAGIPTIKLFTTYSASDRRTFDRDIIKLLEKCEEHNSMLLVHAENESIVLEGEPVPVSLQEQARPSISEISEVVKLSSILEYIGGKLYIVHTTCGSTVKTLLKNYSHLLGESLFIESCPHYFYLSSDLYKTEDSYKYTMTPPLRNDFEKQLLRDNYEAVHVIGTDHCPFHSSLKDKPFTNEIAMGIGGIESSFRLMFTLFGEKVIDKFTLNPAKIHGLFPSKGIIKEGSDADLVIYNPKVREKITSTFTRSVSKADYSCFENIEVLGKIDCTISNGKFIFKDGSFIGGKGSFIRRSL